MPSDYSDWDEARSDQLLSRLRRSDESWGRHGRRNSHSVATSDHAWRLPGLARRQDLERDDVPLIRSESFGVEVHRHFLPEIRLSRLAPNRRLLAPQACFNWIARSAVLSSDKSAQEGCCVGSS